MVALVCGWDEASMNFTAFLYPVISFERHIIIARGLAFKSWANPWSLSCRTTAPGAISASTTVRLKHSSRWWRILPDENMQNDRWSLRKIGASDAFRASAHAQPMRCMRLPYHLLLWTRPFFRPTNRKGRRRFFDGKNERLVGHDVFFLKGKPLRKQYSPSRFNRA